MNDLNQLISLFENELGFSSITNSQPNDINKFVFHLRRCSSQPQYLHDVDFIVVLKSANYSNLTAIEFTVSAMLSEQNIFEVMVNSSIIKIVLVVIDDSNSQVEDLADIAIKFNSAFSKTKNCLVILCPLSEIKSTFTSATRQSKFIDNFCIELKEHWRTDFLSIIRNTESKLLGGVGRSLGFVTVSFGFTQTDFLHNKVF